MKSSTDTDTESGKMPPPQRPQFDLLTHAPKKPYPNVQPESPAVKLNLTEVGLKTLGGVPK